MPKLGRRQNDSHQVQYLYPNASVTKNAPFGTGDTPQQKIKIIGGKPVLFTEDGFYSTPRWAQSPDPVRSPKGHMTPASRGSGTPQKLAPMTEKPNHFNPAEFLTKGQNFYTSAHQDVHNSHIHSPEPHKVINPHQVVPPISAPSTEPDSRAWTTAAQDAPPRQPAQQPAQYLAPPRQPAQYAAPFQPATPVHRDSGAPGVDLTAILPKDGSYLPSQPVHLRKEEELELRWLVRHDLQGFNVHKLKDLYLELTGFDHNLTGFVTYTDLGFALLRGQMAISAMTLRFVACMFVDPTMPGKVNYEKVLSFLSASLRHENPPSVSQGAPQASVERADKISSNPKDGLFRNPITQETNDLSKPDPPSPRTKKFPFGTGDNAKLLRMIEAAILESGEDLDFDKIWATFGRADRGHRGMLSREQIKTLAYASRIPLQDSILDKIIDKLDTSNGQYNWSQFIEFMERVQPMKTGLRIPESKRPTEYVKHYPMPSTDWPQNREDLLKQPQESRMPTAPPEPSAQTSPQAPPRGDRVKQQEQHQQQETAIKNVQREFKKLEDQYETAKKKLHRTQTEAEQGLEPWFTRFMKLANALYENDLDKNGHLTKREMDWLIHGYNDIHQLGISSEKIKAVIASCAESDRHVPIDPVLKSLRD